MSQSFKRGFTVAITSLVILMAVIITGRSFLIRHYVNGKLATIQEQRHLSIQYANIYMEGLSTLCVDNLSVIPENADTFLYAANFKIKLDLPRLLLFKADVENVTADSLHIHFRKNKTGSNFDFLYKSDTVRKAKETSDKERDYARKAEQTLNLLFKLLPKDASLQNLCISYSNTGDELMIEIPTLKIADSQFSTGIHSTENGKTSEWVCEGLLHDDKQQMEVRLYAKENTKITLPFLEYRWGAVVQFDTLALEMKGLKEEADLQTIRGKAHISGLTLHHERISPDTILLDKGILNYQLHVGKNYMELDSATQVGFNQLNFHPYIKLEKDKEWHLTASVDKRDFLANDFFTSLPTGLFSNLEGIETAGVLSYHFLLDVDFAQVDSLLFESELSGKNFHILQYGKTDLRKMNEPFLYTAYEKGEPVRTFEVGESNPSFRSFASVSRYLPLAIMQSEDAGFFNHAGFIPSAIRESLIQNMKEKRFARGGSTLSMQLVKNVFLSRHKTIARKLEEILIVWLIEGNRLTTKERMFEVYLNIVEWGPLLYGASEASHFYFAKEPSALTLSECIYMASIIPKPKYFRSCFDGSQLKPYYEDFFRVILTRLVDRELITPEEAIGVSPESVKITGAAKSYLATPADSSSYLPDDLLLIKEI